MRLPIVFFMITNEIKKLEEPQQHRLFLLFGDLFNGIERVEDAQWLKMWADIEFERFMEKENASIEQELKGAKK